MKNLICGVLLLAAPLGVHAASEVDVETIKQQVLEELKPIIEAEVQRRVAEELAKRAVAAPVPGTEPPAAAGTAATTTPWSPAQPIPLVRAGPAYLNLSLSTLIDLGWSTTADVESLQAGGHDPAQRGFSLPNTELAFDGAVDPYFRGQANVVLKVEEDGATELELEEAFLVTTALPANLQLKAGRFFTEFGRHNPLHPHEWSFVDLPLVLGRLLGPDGLQQNGARVSWLAPTPFYAEAMLAVLNGQGETAFSFRSDDGAEEIAGGAPVERSLRGPQDLVFAPRLATALDLGETQTLLLGASGAVGPNNSGNHATTWIVGGDVYWKWRPVNAARGFPFVSVQSEFLYRNYEAAARAGADDPLVIFPRETLNDWGCYTQVLYGFHPGWVAGLRGEFVTADAGAFDSELRLDRTRLSPNLTWYPTEFSKLRLQYNYDHRERFGDEHSVWFQIEFLLGAHAAHKF